MTSNIKPQDLRHIAKSKTVSKDVLRNGCDEAAGELEESQRYKQDFFDVFHCIIDGAGHKNEFAIKWRSEEITILEAVDGYVDELKETIEKLKTGIDQEREECANIADAIDSKRGNEAEIAKAIRSRSK